MTGEARILVRIMDRHRHIDEFDMKVVKDKPSILVLQAACSSLLLLENNAKAPHFVIEAMEMASEMAHESGFSVRTRLLQDSWLLMVRVDHRKATPEEHAILLAA